AFIARGGECQDFFCFLGILPALGMRAFSARHRADRFVVPAALLAMTDYHACGELCAQDAVILFHRYERIILYV
ncbi:MAG: hypothetical protein NC219_10085, partial [Prevotella sp.]|nr:hypothetical protein [Prevotella sp.]